MLLLLTILTVWWFAIGSDASRRRTRVSGEPEHELEATHAPADPDTGRDSGEAREPLGYEDDCIAFEIRDLANGNPIPGFRVRWQAGAESMRLAADEQGTIRVPDDRTGKIAPSDPNWMALEWNDSESRQSGVLWTYARFAVDGVVRTMPPDDALAPRDVELRVLMADEPTSLELPDWGLRNSALTLRRWLPSPEPDGTFSTWVPRIYGVAVVASARGYKPDHEILPVELGGKRAVVDLILERAPVVRGLLRSSTGEPIKNCSVTIYTIRRSLAKEDVGRAKLNLLKPEGGFTFSIDLISGEARAKFIFATRTESDGSFQIPVTVAGETVAVALPHEHAPAEVELGFLTRDRNDLVLTAERVHESARVRFVRSGEPIGRAKLLMCDLSLLDGHAQPGVYLTTDENGFAVTDWLVPGRRYYFGIGEVGGHLEWRGQSVIEIEEDLDSVSTLPR